ncbi:MAG: transposase [Pseudomonadota bacterium]
MSYKYFIGIDISKETFEVAHLNDKKTTSYSNDTQGFDDFLAALEHPKEDYLIILEATGGYEMQLLMSICEHHIAVHRLSTLKSSHYIRSLRVFSKSDVIDAMALARYGYERGGDIILFKPNDHDQNRLHIL